MPYYRWVGIDIVGTIKRGKQAAYSSQDLSDKLLYQGIAMLKSKTIYTPSWFWRVKVKDKGNLFQHKAKLLRAGLLLPKALEIVAQQSHNPIVYDMLLKISRDVQHGLSFAQTLAKHSTLCDPIVKVMLIAGDESGNLTKAIENVAIYYYKQDVFNKSIRSVLAIPFLTLLFFIGISLFIFIFIIPRFVDMFGSLQQELPPLTQFMIGMSDFIRSFSMVYVVISIGIIIFCGYYYCKHKSRKIRDVFLAQVPFLGEVVWQYHISQILQALSLLLASGMTLVMALKIVSDSVDHSLIKSHFIQLHDDVAQGQLLSNAMAIRGGFLPETIALIHIGQETATVAQSLESAAVVYNDRLENQLRRFVFFLQPIVIILLGLLVTILIFAVYLPIIQLSYIL